MYVVLWLSAQAIVRNFRGVTRLEFGTLERPKDKN